jgi:signal transduction histidine kinase
MFAASAALALVVGAVFAILLLSIGELRSSDNWASHSEQVIATANLLEKEVLDLETGERGFVITGERLFLQPFSEGLVAFPREATVLERLVSDSVPQEARAQTIARAGLWYISQSLRPTIAVARRSLTQAAAIVASGEAKRRLDAIRAQFASFITVENVLLLTRRSTAHAAASRAVWVAVGGLIGVVLLILLCARYLARSIVAPVGRITATAARLASGDFSARTIEGGGGEVADLGRAFNAMASSLHEGRYELANQNVELKARQADLQAVNAELESANAELNAFSYSVSHDLRAPLRAIDGFSRIVIDDDQGTLTDSQQRYLGLVRDNTQVMGTLIDDLLSFSRLANQPLERRTVQTAELVRQVESDAVAHQNARTIEFVNEVLPAVQADPALLRQVFANLLGNALKYSRERERTVVTVGSERRDGELVFIVRDNGVGFDMRYAEKLFRVFQRLHRAEDYEGTGVGLAIVQRIIARHGGRVWAEAKPDEGATFYFTLNGGAR